MLNLRRGHPPTSEKYISLLAVGRRQAANVVNRPLFTTWGRLVDAAKWSKWTHHTIHLLTIFVTEIVLSRLRGDRFRTCDQFLFTRSIRLKLVATISRIDGWHFDQFQYSISVIWPYSFGSRNTLIVPGRNVRLLERHRRQERWLSYEARTQRSRSDFNIKLAYISIHGLWQTCFGGYNSTLGLLIGGKLTLLFFQAPCQQLYYFHYFVSSPVSVSLHIT